MTSFLVGFAYRVKIKKPDNLCNLYFGDVMAVSAQRKSISAKFNIPRPVQIRPK